jgi:hypothetical protein
MITADVAERHGLGTFRRGEAAAVAKSATHEAGGNPRYHTGNAAQGLARL